MKIHEQVACGGKSLLKMPGEKSFWGGIGNFRFCLGGELTLDDTMDGETDGETDGRTDGQGRLLRTPTGKPGFQYGKIDHGSP